MSKEKIPVPLDSENYDYKSGDKIYTVEFISPEEGESYFDTIELEFVNYIDNKTYIEGLDDKEDAIFAELRNPKYPKTPIKTDISTGFFSTPQNAVESFWHNINALSNSVDIAYENYMKEYYKDKNDTKKNT